MGVQPPGQLPFVVPQLSRSLLCSPASVRSALSRMNESKATPDPVPSRFQRTLVQVLIVQGVALTLLGLLQAFYTR